MIEAIEFKNYRKRDDIYGTAMYPAVMVGPVQKLILKEVLKSKQKARIIDPFHGAGTALYEAFEINPNFELYGIDINPLANIITKAKLQGVDKNIRKDINHIKNTLENQNLQYPIVSFPKIEKWFRADIVEDLSKIKYAIQQIISYRNRVYFWVMFSNIVRKYSNTRSSTYKLHIKQSDKIVNMKNNALIDFIQLIEKNYVYYLKSSKHFSLLKGDTLKLLSNYKNNYFDVLITSPPYGDNATTVTYGQFSILILYWIDRKDLELEGWEYENFSKIDRESLGGYCKNNNETVYDAYINLLLQEIKDERKRKKVRNFFLDYFAFLDMAIRVTKEYLVMTLGNRTVDGINIELVDFTKKFLNANAMQLTYEGKRKIYSKRTPRVLSRKNGFVLSSMNEEYIVIFKKAQQQTDR